MHFPRKSVPLSSFLGALSSFLAGACAGPVTKPAPDASEAIARAVGDVMSAGRFEGEAWRLDLSRVTGAPTQDRSVEFAHGLLLVQDQENVVHAIDAEQGVHRWMVETPGPMTLPVGDGELGFSFIHGDGLVTVRKDIGARMSDRLVLDLESWPFSPVVDAGGSLFFGNGAPAGLQSLDPGSGLDGWHYDTRESVRQVLTWSNGSSTSIIGFAGDGLIFSLEAWPAGGQRPRDENWFLRLPVARIDADAALVDGWLFLAATDGFCYCVNAANGRIQWRVPTEGVAVTGAPIVAGDSVYFAATGGFHAMDRLTGAAQWSNAESRRLITRIGDLCYTEEANGECAVRRASDGVEVSRFSLASFAHIPSVQGGGMFVAGTGQGQLVALR